MIDCDDDPRSPCGIHWYAEPRETCDRCERALEAERRRAPEQHREPVSHAAAHALPDTRAA